MAPDDQDPLASNEFALLQALIANEDVPPDLMALIAEPPRRAADEAAGESGEAAPSAPPDRNAMQDLLAAMSAAPDNEALPAPPESVPADTGDPVEPRALPVGAVLWQADAASLKGEIQLASEKEGSSSFAPCQLERLGAGMFRLSSSTGDVTYRRPRAGEVEALRD